MNRSADCSDARLSLGSESKDARSPHRCFTRVRNEGLFSFSHLGGMDCLLKTDRKEIESGRESQIEEAVRARK